jgi:hypothetical protein
MSRYARSVPSASSAAISALIACCLSIVLLLLGTVSVEKNPSTAAAPTGEDRGVALTGDDLMVNKLSSESNES